MIASLTNIRQDSVRGNLYRPRPKLIDKKEFYQKNYILWKANALHYFDISHLF